MNFKFQQNQVSQLKDRLSMMVVLVLGLLITNMLLVLLVSYMHFHQRIEITPFFSQESYSKTESGVDTQYLKLMSENFLFLRLNVTPESVAVQHKQLLSMVSSQTYQAFLRALEMEKRTIIEQKISSHFDITHIQMNSTNLEGKITGILHRSVGIRSLPDARLQYVLKFKYQLGRLQLLKFVKEEVNAH
jgi:conjugal transfer pilus assembly protein TraE